MSDDARRLIERITKATASDRDLDWEIAEGLGGSVRRVSGLGLSGRTRGSDRVFWPDSPPFGRGYTIPYYTKTEQSRERAIRRLRDFVGRTEENDARNSTPPDQVLAVPQATEKEISLATIMQSTKQDEIRRLLLRIQEAKGPDRLLDHDLLLALGWTAAPVYHQDRAQGGVYVDEDDGPDAFAKFDPDANGAFWKSPTGTFLRSESLPRLTASQDAATALLEDVLPGWWWNTGRGPHGAHSTLVSATDDQRRFYGEGVTAPLAILTALAHNLLDRSGRDEP